MRPRSEHTAAFFLFALQGHLAGKTPEEITEEYMTLRGWNRDDEPRADEHPTR